MDKNLERIHEQGCSATDRVHHFFPIIYFYGHLVNTIYIFEVIYSCNITMESFIIKSCLFGIPLATQASKFGIERPGQRLENETDLGIEK